MKETFLNIQKNVIFNGDEKEHAKFECQTFEKVSIESGFLKVFGIYDLTFLIQRISQITVTIIATLL